MKDERDYIPLDDRVRLIRIRTFFENVAGNPFGFMLVGGLFVLALHGTGVSDAILFAWLALLFLLSCLIFFFERHVRRTGLSPENAVRFFRIRTLLGGSACALCGATVGFLPGQAMETVHAFAFILASSIVTVGYMTYATAFSYCLMVNALTLLPFTFYYFYRYFITGDSFFLLMGITAILWQIVVIKKALRVSRSAIVRILATERLREEIADRELAQEALRVSEDQSQQLASMLRLMCDNVPDMIWAKDLEHRYTFANAALCEKLLNTKDTLEPLGKTFDCFAQRERDKHPDDPEWHTFGQFSQDVDTHTLGRDEPTIFEDYGYVCGDLIFLDIHQARFINAQGELIGTVGCARDITERKASEAFVQHLAHHDVLTGLPNRALLTDRLHQALAQSRRDMGKLAVLFLDLDRLKPVNDTLGHDVGDLLLKSVATRLRDVVTRESDTVARLGGDEFVILLRRVNKDEDAALVADKIIKTLSQPFVINQHRIGISGSIGIAISPQHGDEGNQLLRHADMAMYSAKRAGRNGYRFYDPSTAQLPGQPELL